MVKHGDLITDGSVTWRVVDRRIYGKIADIPNYYKRSALMVGSGTTLITPDVLQVNINDQGFVGGSQTIDLNLKSNWDNASASYSTPANRKGKDFYLYLIATNDGTNDGTLQFRFKLSVNSTVPSGYTATNTRRLGGFHCLCADVGTIEGHPLSGAHAGDILPTSVWDLLHRPISEPEGMVWVKGINKWVDIYLASWNTTKKCLVSVYNGTTADGTSSVKFHGEKFVEEFGLIGKQLPMRDDFVVFAKGSNEETNITGDADAVQTGGHVDTAGRRMISNYGIEDCCGFLWQWTSDIDHRANTNLSNATLTIYDSSVDSRSYGGNGLEHSFIIRAKVGGSWGQSTYCGSRSVYYCPYTSTENGDYLSMMNAEYGARGISNPLHLLED